MTKMIEKAKKLGCKKQYPDCPDKINGIDCYLCVHFPKEHRAKPEIYGEAKKEIDKKRAMKEFFMRKEKERRESFKILGTKFYKVTSTNDEKVVGIVAYYDGDQNLAKIGVANGVQEKIDVQFVLQNGASFSYEAAMSIINPPTKNVMLKSYLFCDCEKPECSSSLQIYRPNDDESNPGFTELKDYQIEITVSNGVTEPQAVVVKKGQLPHPKGCGLNREVQRKN